MIDYHPWAAGSIPEAIEMQTHRIRFLICVHGLTEAQTQAVAAPIWGG